MKYALSFFCACFLCGCAAPQMMAPGATCSRSAKHQVVATPEEAPKPLFLVWGNNNPTNDWPYLTTEIYSTTNLLQDFELWRVVPPLTYSTMFYANEQQRYFINRFRDVRNSLFSEWNVK
jgi:hypothetical protein